MNTHIAEPQSSKAMKALAFIGLLAILFAILFGVVKLVQLSFPENAQSPAAVIESQERVPEAVPESEIIPEPEITEPEPEVVIPEPTPEPVVKQPKPVYVSQYNDIQLSIQNIGFISGGTLFSSLIIDSNIRGGIQFAVKNIGTRYSNTWDMDINLPNGEDYRMNTQPGLAPGETAFITIGFDPDRRDGTYTFDARVTSYGETTNSNNYVSGSMTFID
ncbi:hypothetical protein KTR10_03545 [Candidatus Kaiserbacteria bacterium]|nr:hypothetical protein [Candidatus Kaiserbacteria bacterium]